MIDPELARSAKQADSRGLLCYAQMPRGLTIAGP